jgi:hypothetical protein
MKSFKQFLFESEAVSAETSVNPNTPTNNTTDLPKTNVVNRISPPVEEPVRTAEEQVIDGWAEEWERNNPMPKLRDGESIEDFEKRIYEWEIKRERHMSRMYRIYKRARSITPHGPRSPFPYEVEPAIPLTDEELAREQSWEFLRDLGVPGPWQDDSDDDDII